MTVTTRQRGARSAEDAAEDSNGATGGSDLTGTSNHDISDRDITKITETDKETDMDKVTEANESTPDTYDTRRISIGHTPAHTIKIMYNNNPDAEGIFLSEYNEISSYFMAKTAVSYAVSQIDQGAKLLQQILPAIVPPTRLGPWQNTLLEYLEESTRLMRKLDPENIFGCLGRTDMIRYADQLLHKEKSNRQVNQNETKATQTMNSTETTDTQTTRPEKTSTTPPDNSATTYIPKGAKPTREELKGYETFSNNPTHLLLKLLKTKHSDEELNNTRFNDQDVQLFRRLRTNITKWMRLVAANKITKAVYTERDIQLNLSALDNSNSIIAAKAYRGAMSNNIDWGEKSNNTRTTPRQPQADFLFQPDQRNYDSRPTYNHWITPDHSPHLHQEPYGQHHPPIPPPIIPTQTTHIHPHPQYQFRHEPIPTAQWPTINPIRQPQQQPQQPPPLPTTNFNLRPTPMPQQPLHHRPQWPQPTPAEEGRPPRLMDLQTQPPTWMAQPNYHQMWRSY